MHHVEVEENSRDHWDRGDGDGDSHDDFEGQIVADARVIEDRGAAVPYREWQDECADYQREYNATCSSRCLGGHAEAGSEHQEHKAEPIEGGKESTLGRERGKNPIVDVKRDETEN